MWQTHNVSLCHPLLLILQFQGCTIVCALAIGWIYSARQRLKAIGEAREGRKPNGPQPKVAVVLPVKGLRHSSLPHWRAQLALEYEGELEFIFVVESVEDAAYSVLTQLRKECQGCQVALTWLPEIGCRTLACVSLWRASLDNAVKRFTTKWQAGVSSMGSDVTFVLFLDDDISVHPGTVQLLMGSMRDRPEVLVVTGYPFDIPSRSFFSYCVMAFHLPLSVGFSTDGRTTFVWGGCMMLRAADLRTDRFGLVTALHSGGYSDDMTLAAIAADCGRHILVPAGAIFLHPIPDDLTAGQYFNYLRRQIFVLFTHCSPFNCALNRLLLLLHTYLSATLSAAFLLAPPHLFQIATRIISPHPNAPSSPTCLTGERLSVSFLCCILLATLALRQLTDSVLRLCAVLNPTARGAELREFEWHKVWFGIFLGNFLYPIGAIVSCIRSDIEWSGVRYFVRRGKIERVVREEALAHIPSQGDGKSYMWKRYRCSGFAKANGSMRGGIASMRPTTLRNKIKSSAVL